ncbi:MAG: hypothetical protein ACLVJ6_16630 [Merdibacter sp.]
MRKAYIVAAKRSAIGSFMGGLTSSWFGRCRFEGDDPAVRHRSKDIDEVLVGNVIAAGLGRRTSAVRSASRPAFRSKSRQSINMLCGSGSKAVMEATLRIQAGFGDIYVAGGVE